MATLASVVADAQKLLNDAAGTQYTAAVLYPFITMASEELSDELVLNGIDVVKKRTTAPISISPSAAGIYEIAMAYGGTPALPADLLVPITIRERVYQSEGEWIDLTQMEFGPTKRRESTLGYWAWRGCAIYFPGLSVRQEIIIDYLLTVPDASGASDLFIPWSKAFLAAKAAGLAAEYVGENLTRADRLYTTAERRLQSIVGISVKTQQALPVKRRPFSRRNQWRSR